MKKKICILICLLLFLLSGFLLFCAGIRYRAGQAEYRVICSIAGMEEGQAPPNHQENLEKENLMTAMNPDYRAWLKIPDTAVSYPIVREREDGYYLNHTFKGNENPCGSIFMDANCEFLSTGNTIVYGHNMKDRSMFGSLKDYCREEFFKEHPWIQVLADGNEYTFRVFSCIVIEDGDSFGYTYEFPGMEEKINFLEAAKRSSVVSSDYMPEGADTILTLSTCHGIGGTGRLLVLAAMPYEEGRKES